MAKRERKTLKFPGISCVALLFTAHLNANPDTAEIDRMMTMRQKIGQMLVLGFEGTQIEDCPAVQEALTQGELGAVILYRGNIQNPEQVRRFNEELQAKALEGSDLPLFIAVDYEGGQVNRLPASKGFPETLAAADLALLPDQEIQLHAEKMAVTLKNLGFNLNFAPVVDLNVNPGNPIIGKRDRSFSAFPERVIDVAQLFVNAHEKHHLFYSYKHFPGHGSSMGDTHEGFVDVTSTWQQTELKPYQTLLKNASAYTTVMMAHVVNGALDPTATPASLSKPVLEGLLRTQLGFQGLVISDDFQMKAIADHYSLDEALAMSIQAGSDLVIIANQLGSERITPQDAVDRIERLMTQGKISPERIDESFQRIVQAKRQGLLTQQNTQQDKMPETAQ